MKRLIAALFLTLVATAATAAEQPEAGKQPTPEEMKQLMEMSFGAMVPMMGKMTETMIEAQLKIGEKPETAASLAIFKKNLYDALVKRGFTKKEAFDIMLNTSMPTAMPGMK